MKQNIKIGETVELSTKLGLHNLNFKTKLRFSIGWIVGLVSCVIMLFMSVDTIKTSAEVTTDILYKADLSPVAEAKQTKKEKVSEYAPVTPIKKDKKVLKYIRRFSPVAIAEMNKYKIPASISLAQGIIESRSGTSTLARENNNHFGMKCFSKKCKKGHCSNHHDDNHKDFFKKYKTAWNSWRAHSILLAKSPSTYKPLFKLKANDYKAWALGLKKAGYATDKKYAEKLTKVIEDYELYKFDQKSRK